MQEQNIHVDEPAGPPPEPKEKRYQFRSTARAWRSKHKRHIGLKQFTKQLRAEIEHVPSDILPGLYIKVQNPSYPIPPRFREVYIETYHAELILRGLPVPIENKNDET